MLSVIFPDSVEDGAIPVKNTFIHFDTAQVPPSAVRSATCPPILRPCCSPEDSTTWGGATRVLCHAMASRLDAPTEAKDVYFTPDSSPRCRGRSGVSSLDATAEGSATPSAESWASAEGVWASAVTDTPSGPGRTCVSSRGRTDEGTTARVPPPRGGGIVGWTTVQSSRKPPKVQTLLAGAPRQQVMQTAPSAVAVPGERERQRQEAPARANTQYITQRFELGIEDDCGASGFHARRRLIGPGGEVMKRIAAESKGARVWVSGGNPCPSEYREPKDCMGPLMVCVSAISGPSFEIAVGLVQELLERVRAEHKRHQLRRDSGNKRHEEGRRESSDEATTARRAADPERLVTCCISVGLDEDRDFQVVRRLVGPRGQHMKRIGASAGGARLRVSGAPARGSGLLVGPLRVCVAAPSKASLSVAQSLVEELVETVRAEYDRFRLARGLPVCRSATSSVLDGVQRRG
mmetsp:Transcript_96280/g.272151  ORF Transcript_96280/g.272151 Transcript_96280/m.272151 type:complete len:463 (-) Transcript_96280:390-1778(-)